MDTYIREFKIEPIDTFTLKDSQECRQILKINDDTKILRLRKVIFAALIRTLMNTNY